MCRRFTSSALVALGLGAGMAVPSMQGLAQPAALTTLETGGPVLRSLDVPAVALGPGRYEFRVGFETEERPAPRFLADSFTISLAGSNPDRVIPLATLDTFGLTLAPSNPGGPVLDPAAIRWESVPLLAPPKFSIAVSYRLTIDLPESLRGQYPTLGLDFFDNQNGVGSRGLMAGPAEIIPEPSSLALVGSGLGVAAWGCRKRRSS
jgi:hypothetical protein